MKITKGKRSASGPWAPVGKGVRGVGMWASRRLVHISMPIPACPRDQDRSLGFNLDAEDTHSQTFVSGLEGKANEGGNHEQHDEAVCVFHASHHVVTTSKRHCGPISQFVVSRRRAAQGAVLYDIDYVKWLQHNIASYSGRGAASSARDPCLGWEALTCRFRWKRFGLEPGRAQWPWPCFRATDP